MKTIAGIPLNEIPIKLGELLPPNAYKAVGGGGADLTDINPAYLTKVANEVFGLCGVGWTFDFSPEHMTVTAESKTNSKGREYKDYTAVLGMLTVSYALVKDDGSIIWSEPIQANGANSNGDIGYAMRGALTNALGAAFSKLGWQLPVYMGKVSHHNAQELWEKKHGKAQGGTQTKPKVEKPAEQTRPSGVPEQSTEKDVPNKLVATTSLDAAMNVVIPDDGKIPLHSMTIGEAIKDPTFGMAVLKYLTGDFANQAGDKFAGSDEVKQAAKLVFNSLSQVAKKNSK